MPLNIDFNVIALTKTHENVNNSHLIVIPGYIKVYKACNDGRIGGGVALFFKSNVSFTMCKSITVTIFESVFVEFHHVQGKKVNTVIFVVVHLIPT